MQIYTEKEKELNAKLREGLKAVIQTIHEIDTLEYNIKQLKKWRDENVIQIPEAENISTETGCKI